jgi:hypothetical protein
MAALEILALDESAPQIRAPATGDAYRANRTLTLFPQANSSALTVAGFGLSGANEQNLLDLAGTWNTTGAPSGIKLAITDTASNAASLPVNVLLDGTSIFNLNKRGDVEVPQSQDYNLPSFKMAGFETGISLTSNTRVALVSNGTGVFGIHFQTGALVKTSLPLGWSNTDVNGSADTLLWRDAANTLALRNGASPQALNLYNTYTSASSYERSFARWNANVFEIGTAAAGAGTARDIALMPGSGGSIRMGTHNAIASETVTGYITIKDAGGTSRKLAVVS